MTRHMLRSSKTSPGIVRAIPSMFSTALALAVMQLVLAPSSDAVVIKLGDGTGNTAPPTDDPGVGYVGTFGFESGVYLGNGWVISANHIEFGPFGLGGVTYPHVPASKHQLTTPGVGLADLALYKIDGDPGLPDMKIGSTTPTVGTSVVMHGHGRNRGADVTFGGDSGWVWGTGHSMRWGTNKVSGINQTILDTSSFLTSFDESGGGVQADEAQATVGDSGGAVFRKRSGAWELAGVMFATSKNSAEQPNDYTLYDNLTLIAELATYRAEILSIISQAGCDDGLDEDADGLTDYPADPGCASASDNDERDDNLVCDDGLDNDGDGLFDWPNDPGCDNASDPSEQSPGLVCDDGSDNDSDGLIDWPLDPGCSSSGDTAEQSPSLVCDDGIDNEGDGLIDHAQDPECAGPNGVTEGPPPAVPVASGAGVGLIALILGCAGRARLTRRAA